MRKVKGDDELNPQGYPHTPGHLQKVLEKNMSPVRFPRQEQCMI